MSNLHQRTMTEQVMERLRDMILSGELAPGSRL
ncbi:MAG: GntR family transcriptional regulator, partial [Roseiflexus castenholzii]